MNTALQYDTMSEDVLDIEISAANRCYGDYVKFRALPDVTLIKMQKDNYAELRSLRSELDALFADLLASDAYIRSGIRA